MTVVLFTSNGEQTVFSKPVSLRFQRSVDTPADALFAVFAVDTACPRFMRATAYYNGQKLFDGGVDQQQLSISTQGRLLSVSCRSHAAALLDSEAIPGEFVSPRLSDILQVHAHPYGITEMTGKDTRYNGRFTVLRGMSEWEVIESFCHAVYGRTPTVDVDNRLVVSPPSMPAVAFSYDGAGQTIGYLMARTGYKNSRLLSEIVTLKGRGEEYGTVCPDQAVQALGVVRRRVMAWRDYSDIQRAALAKEEMDRRHFESHTVELTLPGMVSLSPGQSASFVPDKGIRWDDAIVCDVVWTVQKTGLVTTVTLIPADHSPG